MGPETVVARVAAARRNWSSPCSPCSRRRRVSAGRPRLRRRASAVRPAHRPAPHDPHRHRDRRPGCPSRDIPVRLLDDVDLRDRAGRRPRRPKDRPRQPRLRHLHVRLHRRAQGRGRHPDHRRQRGGPARRAGRHAGRACASSSPPRSASTSPPSRRSPPSPPAAPSRSSATSWCWPSATAGTATSSARCPRPSPNSSTSSPTASAADPGHLRGGPAPVPRAAGAHPLARARIINATARARRSTPPATCWHPARAYGDGVPIGRPPGTYGPTSSAPVWRCCPGRPG